MGTPTNPNVVRTSYQEGISVLVAVIDAVVSQLKYMRGFHPLSGQSIKHWFGNLKVSSPDGMVTLPEARLAYSVLHTHVLRPVAGRGMAGDTLRVWITSEGVWIVALYSEWRDHDGLQWQQYDHVYDVLMYIRDNTSQVFAAYTDWRNYMPSVPLAIAQGLLDMIKETADIRLRDCRSMINLENKVFKTLYPTPAT